ncbi:unnamed protein product [Aspergillus oryzae]|nr:unnamed protein product [Aspergillus oryzae]
MVRVQTITSSVAFEDPPNGRSNQHAQTGSKPLHAHAGTDDRGGGRDHRVGDDQRVGRDKHPGENPKEDTEDDEPGNGVDARPAEEKHSRGNDADQEDMVGSETIGQQGGPNTADGRAGVEDRHHVETERCGRVQGSLGKGWHVEDGDEICHEHEEVGDPVGVEVPLLHRVPVDDLAGRGLARLGGGHQQRHRDARAS